MLQLGLDRGRILRKLWFALALSLLAAPVEAHDFWLQAVPFVMPKPRPVLVTVLVGHGTARDRWGVDASHVVKFYTIGPDGDVDRKPNMALGAAGYDAILPLGRPGSYVLAMETTLVPSQLPFLRFNDYVNYEGDTPVIEQRKRLGQEQADGREIYTRRAKTIIQVGPVDAASIKRVTRPLGMTLEIVPEKHPQALGGDRNLPLRILFNGRPLAGALVKLTDLDADAEPVAKLRTGSDGRVTMHVPKPGKWQLNCIWSVVLHNDPRADFQTTFASLAFALPQ
jgi:uncharacterized GH25 family protein